MTHALTWHASWTGPYSSQMSGNGRQWDVCTLQTDTPNLDAFSCCPEAEVQKCM